MPYGHSWNGFNKEFIFRKLSVHKHLKDVVLLFMWLFSLEVLISFLNTSYDFVIALFKKAYCQNNLISYPHAQKLMAKQTYNVKMEPGKNQEKILKFQYYI